MTLPEIEQMRARHRKFPRHDSCRDCAKPWPCDASRLLAALSAYEDKFNAMDDDVARAFAQRDAAQAALSEAEAELAAMKKRFDLSDERCDSCHQLIETGFVIHDDEGATWCEDCWQP